MKRTLFFLMMLVVITTTSYGQFQQGRKLVGGDLSFSMITDKSRDGNITTINGTRTTFSLAPRFGYFIMNNLAVGGEVNVSASGYNPKESNNSSSSATLAIGPFARYYFDPGVFAQLSFGLGSQSTKFTTGNTTIDNSYFVTLFTLGAGYAFFVNDNVAIEPMLSYQRTSAALADSNPTAREIEGGLVLSVGLQVYLD